MDYEVQLIEGGLGIGAMTWHKYFESADEAVREAVKMCYHGENGQHWLVLGQDGTPILVLCRVIGGAYALHPDEF